MQRNNSDDSFHRRGTEDAEVRGEYFFNLSLRSSASSVPLR
jgi:hypothetical protein